MNHRAGPIRTTEPAYELAVAYDGDTTTTTWPSYTDALNGGLQWAVWYLENAVAGVTVTLEELGHVAFVSECPGCGPETQWFTDPATGADVTLTRIDDSDEPDEPGAGPV